MKKRTNLTEILLQTKNRKGNADVIFLVLVMLLGGLLLFDYGAHLDQRSEQEILYSNLVSYFESVNLEGNFYHELTDAGIINIRNSIEKDHGMAVFYPMFWIYTINKHSPYLGNLIWHLYIYFLSCIGLVSFYYLLRDFFGKRTAIVSILLLFFTPRIFAEMHYNNKDIVFLSLVMLVYYYGWKLYKHTSIQNAILFGIVGAVATNMKIVGMLIWAAIGLYIFISKIIEKLLDKLLVLKAISSVFVFLFFFIIITPAAWGNVFGFMEYLFDSARNFRWNDYVLFDGESYCKSLTGIPRKYLPVIMLITVPVGIWILMIIGILFSGYRIISRKLIQRKKDYIIAVSVIGIAPLGYAVFSATPVYNGWRHFYFVYASIIIFVACAVYYFLEISAKKKIFNMVFCGYIAWLLLGIIVNHPYEYAYYNCLAGNNVEQRYELDYWDMSFKQALEKIAQNDDRSRIGIATCDNPSNWGISAQMCAIRGKYRCRFVTDVSFEEADYIIVNPTYFALYSYEYYEKIQEEFIVVDKMKSYGKTICYI